MPQRSPIILWLLIAATLSVDAVAISWIAAESYPGPVYLVVGCHGLLLSQLSVLCVWAAVSVRQRWWHWFAPVVAAVMAVTVTAMFMDNLATRSHSFPEYLGYYGSHAALLVGSLWLFRQSAFWRNRSGASLTWQFSLAHLLMAMTVVAVLAAAIGSSPFFDEPLITIVFLCSSVALAMGSVWLWSLARHWLLRLGGVLGLAILLSFVYLFAAALAWDDADVPLVSILMGSHYLIQAIVLSLWLGCGPILPMAQVTRAG